MPTKSDARTLENTEATCLQAVMETAVDGVIFIDAHGRLSVGEAKQGEGSIFVGIVHDLTERKRAEELLAQAQNMEMVRQLTGGIAHDLNTLLTVMIGNAEFLSEKLDAREDLRQLAQDIASAGDRAAELTQRLVAFGRG